MKDLRKLFIRTFPENPNAFIPDLTERFIHAEAFGKLIVLPNELSQGETAFPYMCVPIFRICKRVVATIYPAYLEQVTDPLRGNNTDPKTRSSKVIATEGSYRPHLHMCTIKDKYVGKFVSVTNGGVYWGECKIPVAYVGVFKRLDDMYDALKFVYQDM